MNGKISKSRLSEAEALPPEWSDLLPEIRQEVERGNTKIVVLDDDPTGTQTVHGVPVLTHWSVDALVEELRSDARAIYLLTNSRSLTSEKACELAEKIGHRLKAAAEKAHVSLEIISRSDSTLRGHFPSEVDAMARAMNTSELPYIIIPAFFEGGRYTVDDIHYVAEAQWLIPAAETGYAQDEAFGYRNSNLRAWVEEKTGGRVARDQVTSISLEDIRNRGPVGVEQILTHLPPASACVVNATGYRDLEIFVKGLLAAEHQGFRYLIRSAASFVRIRAGLDARPLLTREDLLPESGRSDSGGLFVVGSHVQKTTDQVNHLLGRSDIVAIEVEVEDLLDDLHQRAEVARVCIEATECIEKKRDVLIYTSRKLVSGGDAATSLHLGSRISDSLVDIVRKMAVQPHYLVAKGGVTSSDLATRGLGVSRAVVMGQVLPGVPVWLLGSETLYPGMPYIVFPGNVGDVDALTTIRNRLRHTGATVNP